MVRVVGVNLPLQKRIGLALTSIFGIGLTSSKNLLATTGVSPNKRTRDLSTSDFKKLRSTILKDYKVEVYLRQYYAIHIKRLIAKKCLRGRRHISRLPVRGQRTRTNARTRRNYFP
jgi:small subunit ribosomal protein S13